jgi:hypothetical protein
MMHVLAFCVVCLSAQTTRLCGRKPYITLLNSHRAFSPHNLHKDRRGVACHWAQQQRLSNRQTAKGGRRRSSHGGVQAAPPDEGHDGACVFCCAGPEFGWGRVPHGLPFVFVLGRAAASTHPLPLLLAPLSSSLVYAALHTQTHDSIHRLPTVPHIRSSITTSISLIAHTYTTPPKVCLPIAYGSIAWPMTKRAEHDQCTHQWSRE